MKNTSASTRKIRQNSTNGDRKSRPVWSLLFSLLLVILFQPSTYLFDVRTFSVFCSMFYVPQTDARASAD